MQVVADTGFIIAFWADSIPERQNWAAEWWRKATLPALTSEANLQEAISIVGHAPIVHLLKTGNLKVSINVTEQLDWLDQFMTKYSPRADLADACVVRLSELYPNARVLTVDGKDFKVYRRFRDQKVRYELPPDLIA